MPSHGEQRALVGVAAAVASGVAYGAATVLARSLARDGLNSATVLTIRFGLAGLVLVVICLATRRSLWPAPGERLAAALLGTLGYAFEASLFFAALERGTASGVTVVFYAYPALVALIERRLGPALLVAAAGTALVVAGGSEVSMTAGAVLFALGAALSFALYLLASHRFFVRTDAVTRAAWAAGGASVGVAIHGSLVGGFDPPAGHWPQLVAVGVTTAAAFGFLFVALAQIRPTQTAVVLNVEPVAAVALGAVFLSESFGPAQVVGTVLVLAAAIAVSRPTAAEVSVPPG